MKQESKPRYYIGKRQYVPEESDLLCASSSDTASFGSTATRKLYRTGKGSYFLVSESQGMETRVQLMDEKQAFDFMDEHTACINTETYDRIFGEPDRAELIHNLHVMELCLRECVRWSLSFFLELLKVFRFFQAFQMQFHPENDRGYCPA